MDGLKAGIKNVERHIESLQQFGQTVILALNKFGFDTEEEISFIENWCKEKGAHFAINEGFAHGGDGAVALANKVVEIVENNPSKPIQHTYEMSDSIEDKIKKIVTKVYKGGSVTYGKNAKSAMKKIKELGGDLMPVCIAKTQFSFTDNAALVGAAEGFNIHIENLVINNGAGFVVAVAGEIMRMPGLPKEPAANIIDFVNGEIVNLS
jgi:formate--tetrahydrofolate ligase